MEPSMPSRERVFESCTILFFSLDHYLSVY
jgi:hypothetical protein